MTFIDEDMESVIFQQIDIDQYTSKENTHVLRMYGVTAVRIIVTFNSVEANF